MLRSNHILGITVAVFWMVTNGYSKDEVVSPCSKNNAGCLHKCSVINSTDGVLAYKCVCNTGYQLAKDKHNCVLVNEFLFYLQDSDIKGKFFKNIYEQTEFTIKNKYTDVTLPSTTYKSGLGLDFDAHDDYIYYSYFDKNGNVEEKCNISRIHPNGTGDEIVLSYKSGHINNLALDWVAKNLYYTDDINATLNVIHIYNITNRRVLLKNMFIKFLVVHPNKGFIFFINSLMNVYRVNMDGSNLIGIKHLNKVTLRGLAMDFDNDRLYWTDYLNDAVYHSNLDLTDVITSDYIRNPLSLVIYKDWVYILQTQFFWTFIIKLHKISGVLDDKIVVSEGLSFSWISNLKIYSKRKQFINNTHPCSIAANYGGCQKLCFAVPSNKSVTSSLQVVCGCSDNEKVDSDGKSCVVISVSGGVIKHISYHHVTSVSLIVMYLFSKLLVID